VTTFVVVLFVLTYLGMALGRVPGLRVDRAGIALVASFALLVVVPGMRDRAAQSIDVPTLLVLASLMAVSGELELAGFYDRAAFVLARLPLSPRTLLGVVVLVVGVLSALLTNDVVVFALTPMLVRGLEARGLDPRPYLLATAAASNAGSAATLIGNPQNVLIAQVAHLHFGAYLIVAAPIALGALGLVWAVVAVLCRRALAVESPAPAGDPPKVRTLGVLRGGAALAGIFAILMVLGDKPAVAVGAIGSALLISRVNPTRRLLERIDWPMLLLFVGLFVVTGAIAGTGLPAALLDRLRDHGVDPSRPPALSALCLLGANTIGNVPLVALLLAVWRAPSPATYATLAVLSTLAGNLLVTGSVANLIVFERASAQGVRLRFGEHARIGVPLTLLSFAWAWLWLR
jgi:Na+/H+ antiporter NhaD/arsenite permease-like protein